MTSLAVFAALVAAVAALSFAGGRPTATSAVVEAFSDAVRRSGLTLAPSRTSATGSVDGVEVSTELVRAREQERLAMRCVATISPPLGLALTVRAADAAEAFPSATQSTLEVATFRALTAMALYPDVAAQLLRGPVGRALRQLVHSGLEPRLRDTAIETWVSTSMDADSMRRVIGRTTELARMAGRERTKLPIAERLELFEAALSSAAAALDLGVRRSVDAFQVRMAHGVVEARLERDGVRATTRLDLELDRPFPPTSDAPALVGLLPIDGVESVRIGPVGNLVVEIGHPAASVPELRRVLRALDELASARADEHGPYR